MGALQAKPIRLGAIRVVALYRDSGESLEERLGHGGDSVSAAKAVPAFGLACDRKSLRRRRSAVNYSGGAPVRQPVPELPEQAVPSTPVPQEKFESSEKSLTYLRLLWARRRMLSRVLVYAAAASTVIAFLIPARYESTARLMPPDNQSSSSLAMAAAAMSGAAGGLGGAASDLLGLKSTSDVFVGILTSRTVQDELIQQFDLKKLYRDRRMEEAAAALQGQLIAGQSQYEGLREIYTDNNVRVRTVKARIDELQRQLEKLGGKGESATTVSSQSGDSMYPSIRKLPLLGVTYADLYRKTKIQEAVLETLTKEYEMAKVQEVKEIPTVKVLDVAYIPDKKSFPPRLLVIFLGTAFSFAVATAWIFGKTMWDETDARDARKVFAQEVFSTVAARVPVFSRNASGGHSVNGGVWGRFRRRGLGSSASPEGRAQP